VLQKDVQFRVLALQNSYLFEHDREDETTESYRLCNIKEEERLMGSSTVMARAYRHHGGGVSFDIKVGLSNK
jgi:hypothetical protein